DYHQTNQKTNTGKTLKPWPILVDHYTLTESRSRALGLDLYEWGGAGDERERDSHRKLNGKLCKYSDPAVYSDDGGKTWKKRKSIGAYEGHPGTDYQCRCVALPYVSWD
ncbi:phage minor head protein, partial [Providencia rettgeri]